MKTSYLPRKVPVLLMASVEVALPSGNLFHDVVVIHGHAHNVKGRQMDWTFMYKL